MINQRLFEHYNIDTNKNLQIKNICPRPFDTILIDKNGSCYACECTSWLPQSIGNLQIQDLSNIIQSSMHEHLQESILDNSYRYCNESQCTYIRKNDVKNIDRAVTNIKHLRLAIDDSCNLRCPSCRTELIFIKEGSQFKKRIKLADKINELLHNYKHPIQVHIGSDGDPFASHVYRYFMEQTPERDNIKYSILTNGLLAKDFNEEVPHIFRQLTQLGVSIDGATKNTYEKLRLGGNWEKINENLKFLGELKEKYPFTFNLHMVVQKSNWEEMTTMCELANKVNADNVYFNKMEDWNTFSNFNEHTIEETNKFKKYLKEVTKHPKAVTWLPV